MDGRITWAIDEIQRRLTEPLNISSLADAVNLSPSRFAHLFREEVGVSPMRFVRELRMERASTLLERTFLSVKQVMAEVGCNDPSHFARDFRRHHGITPLEYRRATGRGTHASIREEVHAATDSPAERRQQDTPRKSRSRSRIRGP